MSKTRVYELARELNIESRVLLTRLKSLGIVVASHQSTLTGTQVSDVRKAIQSGDTGKAKSSPKVIRRRRPAAAPKEPAVDVAEAPSVAEVSAAAAPTSPPVLKKRVEPRPPALEELEAKESSPAEPSQAKGTPEPEQVVEKVNAVEATDREAVPEVVEAGVEAKEEADSTPAAKVVDSPEEAKSAPEPVETEKRPKQEQEQGGATIVRRASPEEVASRRAEVARVQDSRRQRKAPPTGGRPDDRDRSRPPRGPKPPGHGGGQPRSAGADSAAASSVPIDGPAPLKDVGRSGRGAVPADKRRSQEQARDAAAVKKAPPKSKRDHFNTRSLLDMYSTGRDDEPVEPRVATKKRTVYTPVAQNRKRDLKRRKDLKKTQITTPRAAYRVVKMGDDITIAEFGKQLGVKGAELIKKLMAQGVMASINQTIDFDTATLIASEYSFEVQSNKITVDDVIARGRKETPKTGSISRPPIVTIMGHVDHGKTSILDAIRQAKVASGEAGGITQHIGAYTVQSSEGKTIAFLDTPGHEAFSAMRQRGAKVTDIVVLVVAADDGVMPQTVEAISHAKDAGVPMIVAINKIDKPNKNLDRIYTELMEHGIQSEEWGGDTQFVKVSAIEKIGLDDLLEAIVLQAEVLELTASEGTGQGIVVEAHLDVGRGPVATIMVQDGFVNIGATIVAGHCTGKVRAMTDHTGTGVESAGPSTPVEIVGLDSVPMAGDSVHVMVDEKSAKDVAQLRKKELRDAENRTTGAAASLEELLGRVKGAEIPSVPVIVKADTQGSVEAICDAVSKLDSEKVRTKIVHKGAGGVTESDIRLGATSGAVIVGFNVRTGRGLTELADKSGVPIKYFSVIYDVVDAIKAVMAGTLPPVLTEVIQGHAEVRQTIKVPKIGIVAGTAVLDGKITRNSSLRLIRDDVVIYDGKIGSLRRFKDDVKEVVSGYECGIGIEGCNDIREGDVIESYIVEEERATL